MPSQRTDDPAVRGDEISHVVYVVRSFFLAFLVKGRDFYLRERPAVYFLSLLSLFDCWFMHVQCRIYVLGVKKIKDYHNVFRPSLGVAAAGRPKYAEAEPFL